MYKVMLVNFKKAMAEQLPALLRWEEMLAWIRVLAAPLESLHYQFIQKREKDLYKLEHNGQVCYLKGALNNKFDPVLNRIEITNGKLNSNQYIYTDSEEKPKYIGTIYVYPESVFSDTGYDFIVLIPIEVYNREKTDLENGAFKFYEIEALVDFYKLASKRYKIELKNE